MGNTERVSRGVVGFGMIAAVLLVPSLSEGMLAGPSLLCIYVVFTAITRWDPLYALGRTFRSGAPPVPSSASAHPRDDVQPATAVYKKAA